MKGLKPGYQIQFTILKKDLPKIKKLILANKNIIVRGTWNKTDIYFS